MRSKTVKIHNAGEALPEPPPIDWIIEDLFSKPSVNIIVGEGGSKKTYCMLDLMICIASGKDWLGMKVKQMPCLFVDEESGHERMLRRLHWLLTAHGVKKSIPFYFTTLEQFNFRDHEQVKMLSKTIKSTKSGFVAIDALADVILGGDENSVRDVMPVFNFLRSSAADTGSCTNIIHHTNRKGAYRGSSSIHGAVDLMLGIESKRETSIIKIETIKERDMKAVKFTASIDFQDDRVVIKTGSPKSLSAVQKSTLSFFKKNPEAEISHALAKSNGYTEASVRRAIYDLVALDLLTRTNAGERGKPAQYSIA